MSADTLERLRHIRAWILYSLAWNVLGSFTMPEISQLAESLKKRR